MKKCDIKVICTILCFSIFLSGCGTILYPERANKSNSGRLDSKIVLFDGLLCLCFIIPGVVAFIIDIDNGTIYLPGNKVFGSNNNTIADNKTATKQKLQIQFLDNRYHPIKNLEIEATPGNRYIADKQMQKFAKEASFLDICQNGKKLGRIALK